MKLTPLYLHEYVWFEPEDRYALVGVKSQRVHVVCSSQEFANLIKKAIEEQYPYDSGYYIMKVGEE